MSNINAALASARQALIAQQAAMAMTGENIANANTPGYARRTGELIEGPVIYTPSGGLGTGVNLQDIRSVRDPFIEQQLWRASADGGRYQMSDDQLQLLQTSLGNISDSGLSAALDNFWNSWQQLATDPTSLGARGVVQAAGRALAGQFKSADTALTQQDQQISDQISSKIDRVNDLTSQIAKLNVTLQNQLDSGDIDDQRTKLMDELSQLCGAQFRLQDDGSVSVNIGGVSIVERGLSQQIRFGADASGRATLLPMQDGGLTPRIDSGEIAGLITVRDDEITSIRSRLNNLAVTIAKQVNQLHTTGTDYNGNPAPAFFNTDTTGIKDFRLSDEVAANPAKIAASANGQLGDNSLALAIGELATAKVADDGSETINGAYSTILSDLGSQIQNNQLMSDSAKLSVQQMQSWRDSVSGVSVDEEMTQLIRYQNGYNAAAKLTSVISQMMDTLLTISQ